MRVLPQFQTCLEKFIDPEKLKYSEANKAQVQFLSGKGRVYCLAKAITLLFFIIISPFLGLFLAFRKEHTDNKWKALDMALTCAAAPFVFAATAIRGLAGAIIHPKLYYTLETPTRDETALI